MSTVDRLKFDFADGCDPFEADWPAATSMGEIQSIEHWLTTGQGLAARYQPRWDGVRMLVNLRLVTMFSVERIEIAEGK
jgi:hypothetical protein